MIPASTHGPATIGPQRHRLKIEVKTMETPTVESHTTGDTLHLLPSAQTGSSSFRGRNPAIADLIRARLENERTILAQALAAFQAELTAHAA